MRGLVYQSAAYALSAALQRILAAIVLVWMARELAVTEYGRFGLLYALQQGVVVFALGGLVEAVVGQLKEHRTSSDTEYLFRVARAAFCVGLLAALIACGAYSWASSSIVSAGAAEYACVLASGAVLAAAMFMAHLERLRERHARAVLLNFVPAVAGLSAGAVAVAMTGNSSSFFAGSAASSALSLTLLGVWTIGGERAPTASGTLQVRNLLLQSLPFLVVALIGWLSGYGNNYVIEAILGREDVGYYTLALAYASLLLMVTAALNQVWTPRFYALSREMAVAQLERINCDFHSVLAFALGMMGGAFVIAMPVIAELVGGNFAGYGTLRTELALMFWGYVVLTPWWQCANYLLVNGMGTTMLRITVGSSALGMVVWVVLMFTVGRLGVYLGFAAMMILRSAMMLYVAKRHWPIALEWRGKASATAMLVLASILSASDMHLVASLIVYGVTGVALFFGVLRREFSSGLAWR